MKEYSFEQFEKIGTVIVDEAHHICAEVFSRSLFKMCPRHIYGLSATPDRKDGLTKVLHWFMGPTFFSIERENQKQVCVFPVMFDCPQFRECPPTTRFGKLCLAEMINLLTYNEERNKLLVDLIQKASKDRHLLVLSDRRAHCEWLHSQFPENSGLYMGGMKQVKLEESSKKNIIIGTFSQAHEGLDIPSLDTVILATPKSDIKQSIGRILRETTGKKNDPHIYDICDHWSMLFSMYSKRKKVYQQGGFLDKSNPEPEPVRGDLFKGKCIL
jgi:superfamily II DNA or RNA helicase